ncbi:response regulator [Geotalea daltonii FRC-32]|uniref:Response regulator n=1 Tax=Geotalea daltonii (strain DSM 22248 / JCM 15807 / FRC-32) TaxID=316067 RepID=B9M6C8_GEODF|nr:response regulator [Geotalea daltonii]ACM21916.1 response regulator [Geotalea daltonii FRC-32]
MKKDIGSAIDILLVEDNPGDVELVREALGTGATRHILNVVRDGVQALNYLRRQGSYADRQLPDLVLLDLNLPRKGGREVLEEIKSDPDLKWIPIVVLTSSKAEEDILKSYSLHANCYVTKPVDFEQFMGVVKAIEDFWLTTVKLPFRH